MSVSDGLRQLCRPREQCQSIVEFPVDPEEVAQRDVKRRGGGRRCSSGLSPSIDDRDERVNTRCQDRRCGVESGAEARQRDEDAGKGAVNQGDARLGRFIGPRTYWELAPNPGIDLR